MAYIELPEGLPGILGPMTYRPETAVPLNALAEVLLRGDHTLSRGDRETIAAYVSNLNDCRFCQMSHSMFAALQLDEGMSVVEHVKRDPSTAPISEKLRALLKIAAKVQSGGRNVSADDIALAREHGASDLEVHDTVLIAAAFCMFNRYVDGLDTWAPSEEGDYKDMGRMIVDHGYVNALPRAGAGRVR